MRKSYRNRDLLVKIQQIDLTLCPVSQQSLIKLQHRVHLDMVAETITVLTITLLIDSR